jgi:hypothetical protein
MVLVALADRLSGIRASLEGPPIICPHGDTRRKLIRIELVELGIRHNLGVAQEPLHVSSHDALMCKLTLLDFSVQCDDCAALRKALSH